VTLVFGPLIVRGIKSAKSDSQQKKDFYFVIHSLHNGDGSTVDDLIIASTSSTIESLRAAVNGEGIPQDCPDTQHAVLQYCMAFQKSGRVSKPISDNEIGALFGIDPNIAWTH
jgi:uncharacterized protein (DUF849 family)